MSLLRRWFDPLRSQWYYNRPQPQVHLSINQGIAIYLRLDDVYSYLAVQQLRKLEDILVEALKPLKIIVSDQAAPPPNGMSTETWQSYSLNDAKILAMQHGFAYDDMPEMPSDEAIAHAKDILKRTPLTGRDFLYLLEDTFHMLWQQQYGKLRMLHGMLKHRPYQEDLQFQFSSKPVLTAHFLFGGRQYHAVDDLLRLTRRLQQQKLLTSSPIFLINHIEWREHLIQDPEELTQIQALQPELDLYIALEDPISWLLLAYIKDELADLYNIQLTAYPLPYQGRDVFDWSLATRLSKRTEVPFTPFCRPDAQSVLNMAKVYYQADDEQRFDVLLEMLKLTWTKAKDLSITEHLKPILEIDTRLSLDAPDDQILEQLEQNAHQCESLQQPSFPVMVLRVAEQTFVFNSLYRVWMIESIFANILEKKSVTDAKQKQQEEDLARIIPE